MATHIGSVFLGDFQRHRILSSSSATPPSSPPPSSPPSSISAFFPHPMPANHHDPTPPKPPPHPTIDPELALDLRLRWLEAILLGVKQDYSSARDRKGKEREKPYELSHGETLCRITEDLQRRLDAVVEGNDGLKRFMSQYDQHAHLLTPAFALSGTLPDPPSYENMSPEQLEAFLTEMEPDIRAADRDMREIELLEQKGVTGAGKLADYEYLQPRLDALLKEHRQDLELAASLEKRVAGLIERHATQVDALSELFVEWDDTITLAESKVTKLEREREERRRLGLEY
ncbi:hypothetical protein Hypma_012052 [Hypsizygus marmoreus]|uniref:Uncharacterized protein n=1 Tax=Hypsizygus marmoreus TaxID=39966 RepID=A0A369JQ07_HYPMA|nr:hypothetical protein Hypma_012052 [Hypsizygus marmoreus]